MAGAPQGPLVKVDVRASDEFTAPEDADAELRLVQAWLGVEIKNNNDKWVSLFRALNAIRSLCLFHPDLIRPHMGPIAELVHCSTRSLRSSMVRNAMLCVKDMYAAAVVPLLDSSILTESVQCLIEHCGSKQNFIAKMASEMVQDLQGSVPVAIFMVALCMAAQTKHIAAAGEAMVFLEACLAKLGVGKKPGAGLPSVIEASIFERVLAAVVNGSEGRHEAGRTASKKCLRRFRRAMGQEVFEARAKAALPVNQYYQAMKHSAKPVKKGKGRVGGISGKGRAGLQTKLSIRERFQLKKSANDA